jgi:hypothetical protein
MRRRATAAELFIPGGVPPPANKLNELLTAELRQFRFE